MSWKWVQQMEGHNMILDPILHKVGNDWMMEGIKVEHLRFSRRLRKRIIKPARTFDNSVRSDKEYQIL